MDILDVCDPTPDGYRYILVIADYFSKWTEAFPIKNKCADTVADVLVDNIILRFGMPLVILSDHGCPAPVTHRDDAHSSGRLQRYVVKRELDTPVATS